MITDYCKEETKLPCRDSSYYVVVAGVAASVFKSWPNLCYLPQIKDVPVPLGLQLALVTRVGRSLDYLRSKHINMRGAVLGPWL